jgi:hypothetical protein
VRLDALEIVLFEYNKPRTVAHLARLAPRNESNPHHSLSRYAFQVLGDSFCAC